MDRTQVVIMGAAGRDFHDFNVVYRDDPAVEVVAFTATQIPGIDHRRYPAALAGPLYPDGIDIVPETELERIFARQKIDRVVFAYSDVAHEFVMHQASRVLAGGANFALLGPVQTMIRSTKPVVATGATRTGAGKSQTTRYLARLLEAQGLKVVVIRHPMPYGDLWSSASSASRRTRTWTATRPRSRSARSTSRISTPAGSSTPGSTTRRSSARRRRRPTSSCGTEGTTTSRSTSPTSSWWWRTRFGRATRCTTTRARPTSGWPTSSSSTRWIRPSRVAVDAVRANIATLNPRADVILARSTLTLEGGTIEGKRVAVVEDGPTLTHGGMTYGAGIVAARRFGAAEVVDPVPYAMGSLAQTLAKYPALQHLLPAMGYGQEQMHELEETLNAMPADLVLAATPIDLNRVLHLQKPVVRVRYELEEVPAEADVPTLTDLVAPIVARARAAAAPVAR